MVLDGNDYQASTYFPSMHWCTVLGADVNNNNALVLELRRRSKVIKHFGREIRVNGGSEQHAFHAMRRPSKRTLEPRQISIDFIQTHASIWVHKYIDVYVYVFLLRMKPLISRCSAYDISSLPQIFEPRSHRYLAHQPQSDDVVESCTIHKRQVRHPCPELNPRPWRTR